MLIWPPKPCGKKPPEETTALIGGTAVEGSAGDAGVMPVVVLSLPYRMESTCEVVRAKAKPEIGGELLDAVLEPVVAKKA